MSSAFSGQGVDDTAAKKILQTFDQLEVKPPAPVAAVIEHRAEMLDRLQVWIPPHALAPVVLDAIERGADVANDPAVIEALRWAQLHSADPTITPAMRRQLLEGLRMALTEYADAVTSTWGTAVAAAAAQLTAAHKVLGETDLDDADAIVRLGGQAAEAWGVARAALTTVEQAHAGWRLLFHFTRGRRSSAPSALVLADLAPEVCLARPELYGSGKAREVAWGLIAAGVELDLATLDRPAATAAAAHELTHPKVVQLAGPHERVMADGPDDPAAA